MSSLNHGYWKSMAELEPGTPDGEAEVTTTDEHGDGGDAPVDPLSRRNFVQLMGASMALAGVAGAGCKRWEREEIVPLSRRPEDQVPGTTQQYATVFELAGQAEALLVTSYEGRPIKVDGNPEHPWSGSLEGKGTNIVKGTKRHGASSLFAQASILHLYDPDRSQAVRRTGQGATFGDFKAWIGELRKKSNTAKIRVLAEATSSPTVQALRRRLTAELPGLGWHEWEPVSYDNERAGMKLAFGRVVRPIAHLEHAETIVTLDCNFFGEHPASLRYARDWARSRRLEDSTLGGGKINRLYTIESTYTQTGTAADHRLAVRAEHVLPFAQELAAKLGVGTGSGSALGGEAKIAHFVEVLAEEVQHNTGRVVFLAGRNQPAALHALVAQLNQRFAGTAVEYVDDPDPDRPTHAEAIATLAREINQQQVEVLLIIGGNPVFDAPADLDFAGLLAKVPTSVHLSEYADETSAKTTWHVPKAHYLEAWGDARTWDGTYTVQQPLIAPMYGGISTIELLAMLLGDDSHADELVKRTFEQSGAGGTWRAAVHDGFVDRTQLVPAQGMQANPVNLPQAQGTAKADSAMQANNLEVVFLSSPTMWDGRFANNSWLQEVPEYLTKVVWDNVALVAPDTADRLSVSSQDMVKIQVGDRSIEMPVLVMPGHPRGSIGVWLGGGRTAAGKVGNKGREWKGGGFDVYKLRTTAGLDFVSGAKVTKTGARYKIATTQEHFDLHRGLPIDKHIGERGTAERLPLIIRETDVQGYQDPTYKAESTHPFYHDHEHGRGYSLFKEKEYDGHKWGMAIDLGTCSGCNACVVACQSENNIPVVGKREVTRNREMHWIRLDRYFKGSVHDPEVVSQPVACQQCENAPCEAVCPVGATLHSSEGLNDMVYNRCVGTRYCLNNCPYRVRRFNFLNWHKEFEDARNKVRKLLFNPEVTVRERGVMEKCSYCVQRIQNAKIKAKNARNRGVIEDGTITTACQAVCPTEAIVFGDLADPNSRVSRLHADKRQYELLGDLNDKPRTRYLARVRNPNRKLVPAGKPAGGHH